MQEVTRTPERAEGEIRLHAAIRAVLSPGIWFVLAAQIALLFVLQWRVPADATPLVSTLAVFLTATALMLFFFLQAGAFHALTLGREALTVGEIMRAGQNIYNQGKQQARLERQPHKAGKNRQACTHDFSDRQSLPPQRQGIKSTRLQIKEQHQGRGRQEYSQRRDQRRGIRWCAPLQDKHQGDLRR